MMITENLPSKQIGPRQTSEVFLGNVVEIIVVIVVIFGIFKAHVFITVTDVGLVWKDVPMADGTGSRWP